ncbi:PilZ domain-containing protein [Hwanghaeella grinnelliae]|uniref:PilZ domain-containing protein n=1 Tax=Hwanghaeella grinnelliae TaxID=2500179 RepID=A0A437QW00_9PROT|nr:PilZ domain-containing protein [Hwanghaeella grinnelliae]RVU38649.1 PilZ domain-containing protein [Hwanghaeella grinnelliae]
MLRLFRKSKKDRRKDTRHLCHGCFVAHNGVQHPVRDISLGGLFIQSGKDRLAKNAVLSVDLILPTATGQRVLATHLKVVRSTAAGAGCAFTRLEYTTLMSIRQFVLRKHDGQDQTPLSA